MGGPTMAARAEGLILRGLGHQLLARDVITHLGPDTLFHEGETDGIDQPTWDKALTKLVESGRILEYKCTDLPDTLPVAAYQTGYTTPEHLLGLLKKAKPNQVEEIRDFLEDFGVEIPSSATRVPVTAAQKKRIDTAVRKLNEIRDEIAAANPDSRTTWYLDASNTLSLMVEPKEQQDPDPRHIAHSTTLKASRAGDW